MTNATSTGGNIATTSYVAGAISPLATKTQLNSASNVLNSAIWLSGSNVTVKGGTGITVSTVGTTNTVSLYYAPSMTLGNNQNVLEIGTAVTSTYLSWTLNSGSITSQSLDNGIGALSTGTRNYTYGTGYPTDRTFVLSYSDGVTPGTSSSSVYFWHKRYWGMSASASLDSAGVIALSSELSTGLAKGAFYVSPSAQSIYYCYPASWGTAAFTVNNLPNTAWTLTTLSFTNASGNTTTYNVYRSDALLTGTYLITAY